MVLPHPLGPVMAIDSPPAIVQGDPPERPDVAVGEGLDQPSAVEQGGGGVGGQSWRRASVGSSAAARSAG